MEWYFQIPLVAVCILLYMAAGLVLFSIAAFIADGWFGMNSPGLGDDLDQPGFCGFVAVLWPVMLAILAFVAVIYLWGRAGVWVFERFSMFTKVPAKIYESLMDKWGRK